MTPKDAARLLLIAEEQLRAAQKAHDGTLESVRRYRMATVLTDVAHAKASEAQGEAWSVPLRDYRFIGVTFPRPERRRESSFYEEDFYDDIRDVADAIAGDTLVRLK